VITDRWVKFHNTDLAPNVTHAYHALAIHEFRSDFEPTLWTNKESRQKVEQVWFSGAHSDVGGGGDKTGLSDVTLEWMIDRAKKAGLGFDEAYVKSLRPDPDGPIELSYGGLYSVKDPIVRKIGRGGIDEYKHTSVESRQESTLPKFYSGTTYKYLFADADESAKALKPIS
jgi:hypothetical protein